VIRGRRRLLHGWVLADVMLGAVAGVLLVLDLSIFLAGTLPSISTALAAMIAGIATLALAALTGVIIVLNAGVLDATRQAAEATKAEADATLEEAKATREQADATREQAKLAARSIRELQISRELDWRPFVVRFEGSSHIVKGKFLRDVTIQNIGRGPAINCLYLRSEDSPDGSIFLRTDSLNLAPGPAVELSAEQVEEDHPKLFFDQAESPRELLVCHDQFGNFLCFLPGSAGPGVWREERDDRGVLIQGEEEPPWVTAMKEILWGGHRRAEPEPEASYAYHQAISVSGAYSFCHSTVALEAVPATDLKPTDAMRDTVDGWVRQMQPSAQATSPEVARWQVPHPSKMGDAWAAWLSAGPMIGVLQTQDLEVRPPVTGGNWLEADLKLASLIKWWDRTTREGMSVLVHLGVRRMRLGLTLVTSGSFQQTQLVDVDFAGLPRPQRWLQVPSHEIRNWAYRSRPFSTFPAEDLDTAVRQILRIFGYREVDEVMEALSQLLT
jgi:hypothetical protein